MDSEKVLGLQQHIRENSDDLQKYLIELESWEKDMRKKDEEFKLLKTDLKEVSELPPVRNVLYKPKKKSRHKKQKIVNGDDKSKITENGKSSNEEDSVLSKSPGCTDDELKEVSQSDEAGGNSSDKEEELEMMRKKQSALLHKEKGNDFFKKGNYDSAVNSYTSGIMLDPENPLLLANRAMAFLKKEQFQAAENDCNLSLSIDPTYVKAYLRRGAARKKLSKLLLAQEDFSKALELEPENKQAHSELMNINKLLAGGDSSSLETDKKFPSGKPIKKTTEKLEVQDASNTDIECIFANSVAVTPSEVSSQSLHSNPETEVELKEMDEKVFVKTVLEQLKSCQKDPMPSSSLPQMETIDLNMKKILPPVPETCFQFIADWNEISDDPELRYKYLKQFPPENLPIIFKYYMEPTIFPLLLETLSSDFLKNGDDVYDYMKYLPCMGRFRTTLMFLSEKEEKDLEKLLEYIKSSNRPKSEILALISKYKS